jgi:hypothetical protein
MKKRIDMNKVAKGLGAVRRGKVKAGGGYVGAMQLVADLEVRFRVPSRGGRATDPRWTERRLVPLAPQTLRRLEKIAADVSEEGGVNVDPMQLAALVLEKTVHDLSDASAERLVRGAAHR